MLDCLFFWIAKQHMSTLLLLDVRFPEVFLGCFLWGVFAPEAFYVFTYVWPRVLKTSSQLCDWSGS